MNLADIPTAIVLPFAAGAGGGFIRTIPVTSQIGITDGRASYTDGFVPLNATPIGAGGVPPSVKDMNGILFPATAWARWVKAGGPIYFDGTFATAVGGYPLGAVVQSASVPGKFWVSLIDANPHDPDATTGYWSTGSIVAANTADLITGTNTTRYANASALAGLRATTGELVTGTDPAKYATPAALAGLRSVAADVLAGTDAAKYITPLALAGAFDTGVPGVIHLPGGFVIQYGSDVNTYSQGSHALGFNEPFVVAVDLVLIITFNDTGGTSNLFDIFAQWRPTLTTLGGFQFMIQDAGGGGSANGVGWLAIGRS